MYRNSLFYDLLESQLLAEQWMYSLNLTPKEWKMALVEEAAKTWIQNI